MKNKKQQGWKPLNFDPSEFANMFEQMKYMLEKKKQELEDKKKQVKNYDNK